MRIGIDISQIVYEGTGVATYVREMVRALVATDKKNEYVLFGASLRKRNRFREYFDGIKLINERTILVTVPIPPTILEFLWNTLHIVPITWFVGKIDMFWSSDWTQPPLGSVKGVTTIHDLVSFKYPTETDSRIVATHNRRLARVAKACQVILCDSLATKEDIKKFMRLPEARLRVIYPGYKANTFYDNRH